MKKLVSLSLAIIMLLSCMLVQTVAVSAAEAVTPANAPYAGVYQVTADKAVTLTNETGHTVTLAAGATDYFYLIKGSNTITMSDTTATVTYTALEGNGMNYLAEVAHGDFKIQPNEVFMTTKTYIDAGATAEFTMEVPESGMYYLSYYDLSTVSNNYIVIETDTGMYGEIKHTTAGWNHFGDDGSVEYAYLRAGTNIVKVTNKSTATMSIDQVRLSKTSNYSANLSWDNVKVVEYVAEVEPTPEVTPATVTYTAPYAGVYQVTSDKAVTLTNETGHTVTLAAGATDYFYLIKGINTITTTDATATLTFTELEENGMDYIAEVDAGTVPLAGVSSAEVTLQNGIGMAVGAKDTITLEVPVSGLYYVSIWSADKNVSTIYVESDTGFCGEMTPYKGGYQYAVNEANPSELVTMYLRQGTTTLTVENLGSGTANIKTIQVKETNGLKGIAAYIPQLNIAHCIVAEYVESSEPTTTPEPTPEIVTVTYTAPYAGVYQVTSDKAVTLTNETGHTATLEAGVTEYFFLIKGTNTITTTDATATLTFTELEENGMNYYGEVDAGTAPLATQNNENTVIANTFVSAKGSYEVVGNYVNVAANSSVTFTAEVPESGIYYLAFYAEDEKTDYSVSFETDTGFCGNVKKYTNHGWNNRTNGAGTDDLAMVYLRAGTSTFTLKNLGPDTATIWKLGIKQSKELATISQFVSQLNIASCEVYIPTPDTFINDVAAAIVDGNKVTLSGRIGAEWMDELYGVEFTSNKNGTRAQKYYGAKPGDTVSDGNGGTTTFTFDAWDGTFEIVLEGVSAGLKEYKFFVGDNYTDAATFEVAAAE